MTIVGIYTMDDAEYSKEPEDRLWKRHAAWDTDRGVWLATSDGRMTMDFEEEELIDADAEEIAEMFATQLDRVAFRAIPEENIPGEVEVQKQLVEPETDLIEEEDTRD